MAVGKQKTRRAVAKRVKVSGTGKLLHEKAGRKHRLVAKSSQAKGKAKSKHVLCSSDVKVLRKALAA